jgi:hypothetical protein
MVCFGKRWTKTIVELSGGAERVLGAPHCEFPWECSPCGIILKLFRTRERRKRKRRKKRRRRKRKRRRIMEMMMMVPLDWGGQ